MPSTLEFSHTIIIFGYASPKILSREGLGWSKNSIKTSTFISIHNFIKALVSDTSDFYISPNDEMRMDDA